MGGSDQWGNIVTGTELIRRKADGEAYAITTKLITKADGTKFGKTEGGNVWLDPAKTSPYKFYQYWLNVSDVDASNFIRIFTQLSKTEIENLEAEHNQAPHLRVLQKALAKDITCRVHSAQDYELVVRASEILFGNATSQELATLNVATFESVMEGVPQVNLSKDKFNSVASYTDLVSEATGMQIFPSKSEARKMIQAGGVSINKTKITDGNAKPEIELLNNKYVLVQKGKKNYFLIRVD
jgi:tyrosyl-tRNA synthetase